jgi:6-phosphogluconolactonase
VNVEIRVVDDPPHEAGLLLAEAATAGAHVALSGGGTVGAAYDVATRRRPRWRDVHVWFGDERVVPPYDPRSNFRLVRDRLVDRVETPPEVHRIRGEKSPEEAAELYDAALEDVMLDLALNGIGADGHTASLFPSAPSLDERQRRAVAAEAALEPFVPRVTLTPPVFAAAGLLVFLVAGADKADAARRAFAAEPSPETPASLVRGRTTIALLDAEAASALDVSRA